MNKAELMRIINANLPKILTGVAVSGTITTAILAADGHLKAQQVRYEISEDRGKTISNAFKARWKYYAPAVISGITTIAAIVFAQRSSDKRIAAVSAAYSMSKDSYAAYKKAVAEQIKSDEKRQGLDERAAVIQQETSNADPSPVFIGAGKVLCYDAYTGRYFSSDRESIRAAVNDVNAELLRDDYSPLNRFYSSVGLPEVKIGNEIGWNVDHRCEVIFGTTVSEDGKPCLVIAFAPDPIPGWWTRG